jgi:hypothetical protein
VELNCYFLDDEGRLDIRPAPSRRDWMDAAAQRAPYRCIPLVVANGFGWELLSPVGFTAIWNGGPDLDGVVVMEDPDTVAPARSHFGSGILTFHVPALFRTDSGTDLVVQGPINQPKDAIAPLTGVVESDWGPFGFTMNWKFTRAKTAVRFRKGEPFCHIFPVRRGSLETIQPRIQPIAANPELATDYAEWHARRQQFNDELKELGSEARTQKWQKHYLRGVTPRGEDAPETHRVKTSLRPFAAMPPTEVADSGEQTG